MTRLRFFLVLSVVLGISAVSGAARTESSRPSTVYQPGIGDLMTMTVQPRHIKIGLAGHEKNWVYAKYELGELQEAFENVVQTWPKYKGLPLAGMVDAINKGPIKALSEAIERKDAGAFDAAYAKLTEGCDACHQAANVGQIVIKVPTFSSFPNQDFRPQQQ